MTTEFFEEGTTPTEKAAEVNNTDNNKPNEEVTNLLQKIVNEDGSPKYRDVTTAINALAHSQEYIKKLEAEKEELAQKAASTLTLEQVMEKLNEEKPKEAPTMPSGVTEKDVRRILKEQAIEAQRVENKRLVAEQMIKLYGEKAQEVFYQKASELGMTKEAINELSASTPAAVLALVGKQEKPPAPVVNGINTANLNSMRSPEIPSVMGFKSDKEIKDAWAACKQAVVSQYE